MAEEEDTREVLFPDWEGPDKTGLTIEQTGGEIFVKEVKGESPAARSGKVYEGDQIVGATIYFDNMSSEETAELLKTLNRHKVGLKLQNKGDKSPCYSPLSTPCRSPIGTLTWEGKTRFGGSSPDIILSGDDEDYKRIYTKKIKPRLKSEDLAEGVDVRTERHSSTSSDGSTITTITRRITTYTVDMPSGISEQLELSSPDFKGRRHESGDCSPRIRISHGSPSGKVGAEEGVFELSNVTYTGPEVSSKETRWGGGGVHTTTFTREGKERSTDVQFKGPNFGLKVSEGQEGTEMSRGSGEQGDGSVQASETSMTLRDSTHTGSRHVIMGELGTDENGGSISLSIPGKSMQISSTAMDKTQDGSSNTSLGEMKTVNISKITSSHPQTKGSGSTDTPNVRLSGSPMDSNIELRGSKQGGTTIRLGNVGSGFSSGPGKISMTGMDVNITGSKLKGDRDVNLSSTTGELKASGICVDADISRPGTHGEIQKSEWDIRGTDVQIKGPSANTKESVVSGRLPLAESDFKESEINSNIQVKVSKSDSKYEMEVKKPSLSGQDKDVSMKGSKIVTNPDAAVLIADKGILAPKVDSQGLSINTDSKEGDLKMPHIKMSSFGAKGQNVDVKPSKVDIRTTEATVESTDMKLRGPMYTVQSGFLPNIEGGTKGLNVDIKGAQINITGPYAAIDVPTEEGQDLDVKLPKSDTVTTSPKVDIKSPGVHGGGPNVEMKEQKFTIPSTTVNVKAPQFDMKTSRVNVESPDVDIKAAKVDSGFKGPQGESKIKMPSFGQKFKGADVDIPESNINATTPETDVEGHKARRPQMPDVNFKLEEPRVAGDIDASVSIPTLGIIGSKLEGPEVDVGLKGSKLERHVDDSHSKIEGGIKASKVDIEGPDVNIEGHKDEVKMPKIKIPSFDFKGPRAESSNVDINLPKVNTDVKAPDVDIKQPDTGIKKSNINLKGPNINMPNVSADIKGPKLEGPAADINLPKANIDVSAPGVEIQAPGIDVKGFDAKLRGPKFDHRSISAPRLPDGDVSLKGLKKGGVVDASVEGDISATKIDIEGPDIDIESGKGGTKMQKFKVPSVELKGPKVEGPDVDISLQKGEIDVKVPEVDVDIESSRGKIKGPNFNMPSVSLPKVSMPDMDVNLKAPKVKGDVDVSVPKIEGDIKTPKVDIERPDVDTEGSGGFKMPKFKVPSFGRKGPKVEGPDVDVNLPTADVDIKAPEVDIKAQDIDIKSPSGKIKGPKFNMPTISGPNIPTPDLDFKLKGPKIKGDVEVSVPTVEGDVKVPKVDIEVPDVDIEGTGEFKMPKFKVPSIGGKGPKVEGPDVDVSLPTADIDVKAPELDVDIESSRGKIKGSNFNMPSISLPKVSMPDMDLNLKAPKVKGDVDVSVPKIKGDIKTPKVDIEGPDVVIEGTGGFKMPKFKVPSFGRKGPKVEGPDIDVNLPTADVEIKVPEVDIKAPDIDIKSPSGKIKGPKFNMPTISGPNIPMPDVDFNLKGPKIKGDVDVSVPTAEGDVKVPKVDIEVPDVDIEGPGGFKMPKFKVPSIGGKGPKVEGPDVDVRLPTADVDVKAPELDVDIEGSRGKIKGPNFNMPSMSLPKVSMPDMDLNLKAPKVKGDVDLSVPKIEGDIKTPKVDIERPDVDIEGPGGFKMPKFKVPSFGRKGPKVEGADVDVNLPTADVDIKAPEVDIKAPDIDIKSPSGKIKGPKFNMPTISGPKISMPDVDFNLKGQKIKGDVDVSVPKIEGDIKVPKVDIQAPDVDIESTGGFKMPKFKMPSFSGEGPKVEGPDIDISLPTADIDVKAPELDVDIESSRGKIKGPNFNMPSISLPKVSMPDMDLNLKAPKLKGDVDVSVPKIKGDIKTPKVDIEGPDVDIEGTGGFKMPKFKVPSFGFKGPKVEGPDADVSLPTADVNIKAPEVDIKGPDIDIKSPSGKIKGPKFNMPTISGPKISMPDVDLNLKGPKLKGDVDVSVPKIEGDIKTPKVDIEGPDVDIESRGGFKMPKFRMPSIGHKGPKVEGPDIDVNLPTADIDVKAPELDVDIESSRGKIKGPNFNMPSISLPKVSMSDMDLNLKAPKLTGDVDVSVPAIEGDIKNPNIKGDMDASLPTFEGDVKGPNASFDVDLNKSGVTFPKFKGPKFTTKSAEVEGSESTVKIPKFSVGGKGSKTKVTLPETEASLDAPNIDINIKGKKGKFKLPKVKGNAKKPNVDIETPELDVDLETPNIHNKGTKVKKPIFGKLHFPGVELDIKSPKVKADIDLPSASLNTDSTNVCLEEPDVKVKTHDTKMSGLKGGPEVNASVSGGSAAGGLQYPEGIVKFPKLKVPKFGIALPQMESHEIGGKVETEVATSGGMKLQSPSLSYQVSSQNTDIPSPELRQSEGKVKVKMPKLFGKSKAKGSSVGDLTGPEVELTTGGKVSKASTSSVHSGELAGGKFELEGDPGLSVSTKGKSASLDLFKKSRHRSSSLSDEGGLAVSSPSAHLETEGGDISLDLGGGKVKGKKGKLKFGTFGGFGSKSKGSYEVTLGDSEARVEGGAGVSLPSKKSRLSSSSSSDSGSRGGFRFPKLELSMSPKK